MSDIPNNLDLTRRHFLQECRVGVGKMALASVVVGLSLLLAPHLRAEDDKEDVPVSSWTLRVHANGQVTSEKQIDASTAESRELLEAIESWRKKSAAVRSDLNSWTPSVVIESDLRKINFWGDGRVVISTRKSKDKAWTQGTRRMEEADKQLRDRLKAFAQANQ